MRFFFPDSQDFVDPSFDFREETRSETRVRQRDDLYAHEVFSAPPYDGILVSKAIVDGVGGGTGKYSMAQRHRLVRQGVRRFFRLDRSGRPRLETMGDCGAFSYVREEVPPYTVDEVAEFYERLGFDVGISVDHVILAYRADLDTGLPFGDDAIPEEYRKRQEITLTLADEFLRVNRTQGCRFEPMGVAQGWSPRSYAKAVKDLQAMGYRRIALGGMVPLNTDDILAVLGAVDEVRRPDTGLHLLGVTRLARFDEISRHGVISFDSTAPLKQAFMDDRDNYYAPNGGRYTAIRVPQVEQNNRLKREIRAGKIHQATAVELERRCLEVLRAYDTGAAGLEETLDTVLAYQAVHSPKKDFSAEYRRTLEDRPWKDCPCEVCRALGIDVVLFRGAERNRRRGFHNLYVFYRELQGRVEAAEAVSG